MILYVCVSLCDCRCKFKVRKGETKIKCYYSSIERNYAKKYIKNSILSVKDKK